MTGFYAAKLRKTILMLPNLINYLVTQPWRKVPYSRTTKMDGKMIKFEAAKHQGHQWPREPLQNMIVITNLTTWPREPQFDSRSSSFIYFTSAAWCNSPTGPCAWQAVLETLGLERFSLPSFSFYACSARA